MKTLLLAFSFLTSIPVRLKEAPAPGDLGRAAAWFSLVGALIGAAAALAWYLFGLVFPPLLAALLAAVVWIGATGGLHLDGLADCCDGLLNASSPERRLEIMKDPRLGTFGGIGLFLAIALKVIGIYSLPAGAAWVALPLAAAVGRWLLLPAGVQPPARPGGLGADFSAGLRPQAFILAALPVLPLLALAGWRGAAAVFAAHLAAWAVFRFARARLGGVTGDVLGLTTELAELVVLVGFCVRW